MKKGFLGFLLLINVATIFAQQGTHSVDDLGGFFNPIQNNGVFTLLKTDLSIEGTPYLFSDWNTTAEISMLNNKKYVIKSLNYNLKSMKLESKIGKDTVFQFDSNKIDFIRINTGKYKFYKIADENQLCEEIYISDKTTFLKGYSLKLINEVINPMTNAVISNARYDKKEKHFCKLTNAQYVEFDLRKKQILKLFGDKSKQIEKYASDSKLDFTSENDLVKLFKYYDSI